jgi:LuxR family transcriptional regulator, maltose regulon positive regulatory protein
LWQREVQCLFAVETLSMSLPLLKTKLNIPSPRPHLVRRDHLLARLMGEGSPPLTLVSAPAGFGKTTLVGVWIAQTDHAVAWLSLDEDDNDLTRFLAYLVAAVRICQPDLGETVLTLLAAPQAPPARVILTLLLNELNALTTPLALVLDDYHLLSAQPVHEAVSFLIDHLPPLLHLIITTRIDPPLPLARWRVRGQLAEVRADDLRFSPEEATTFLNEVMGLRLSPQEVAALEARTEGWIAGLQLAALSLQGRAPGSPEVTGFIQAFSGSHRHVVSYLVEEVLNRCPPDMLNFLLQTAILERLCADLCNAVICRSDSQALLAKLEQSNLFLISLDDEGTWYRYHHLFAEVLQARLQQTQLEVIPQLHQRASAWHATAGQIEAAVGHALAAQDVEGAATLIERIALATIFQQGEVLLVRRLVERLPATAITSRPRLILAYGITLALSGQFDAVAALLAQAAPALRQQNLPDEIAGGLSVLHSTVARFRGETENAITQAQRALQQLPVNQQALRAAAALNLGAVYLQQGERLAAGPALADAIAWGSDGGAAYLALAALEELATEQIRQGQLIQAKETCEQAVGKAAHWGNQRLSVAGLAHVCIGEVLLEWNEREAAAEALRLGIQRLQATTETGMLVRGYSAFARCQWADGEPDAALATLRQGMDWLNNTQLSTRRAQAWLAAQQARHHLWQNNLTAALEWEHEAHSTGESPLSYLQQFTRVRVRLAQHTRDPQARLLAEATAILSPLLAIAEVKGWGSHVVEGLLLQALIEQAQGQRSDAQRTLARALTLAEAAGYVRLFVDEGEPVRFLIFGFGFWMEQQPLTEQTRKLLAYREKILAAFAPQPLPADHPPPTEPSNIQNLKSKIQNLIEPLSERELEVLHLVAAGLSNSQIAARLIVTTGTVKTHINHIFGKLAVQSRTQAVARARELGLLTD